MEYGMNRKAPWPMNHGVTRPFRVPLSLLCVFLLAAVAGAVEVRDVVWGFDGRVVPGRLNPVTVFVDNPTPKAFDGTLTLYRAAGVGARVGANLAEPCFLSPYAGRWVQFYAYVQNEYDGWHLSWGTRAKESAQLPQPRVGPPARVLIEESDALTLPGAIKGFPEHLFPSTVAGTETLAETLLDHAPRWESARRQAFLDWVTAGGVVHVLVDASGRYPAFTDELAALNPPAERAEAPLRCGAGLVVRHPLARRQATDAYLAAHGFPLPELKGGGSFGSTVEESVLPRLGKMTRPAHNWPVIYWLVGAYIAIVGPVNWLLGRRARDYRWTLAFFLTAIVAFALLFSIIGRRGYGESSGAHTLSYARPLGGGQWTVTQWSSVFVVSGDDYTITHPCAQNLYTTGAEHEAVNGIIQNGKEGRFVVDIPLYSSRSFVHAAKFAAPDLPVTVAAWQGEELLEKLALDVPLPPGTVHYMALYRGRFYPLSAGGGRLQLAGPGRAAKEFFQSSQQDFYDHAYYGRNPETQPNPEPAFRAMMTVLLARATGGGELFYQGHTVRYPTDQAQLFLLARSPAAFNLSGARFGREVGYVLYHLSVFKPET